MGLQKKGSRREESLLQSLRLYKEMSVEVVAETLGVSVPTARRLCTKMANDNLVIRTHGGIRVMPAIQMAYSFEEVQNEEALEKVRIGEYACQLIRDGQTVFLEAGTTILQLAIALARRIERNELPNLIVYTNSMSNLEILGSVKPVNLIGGEYRPARRDFTGYISERIVRSLRFDLCFVGCDALNHEDGIMAQDVNTAKFDELLTGRAAQSIVLAQSAKFNRHSLISYAGFSDVSMIVTDDNLPAELLESCRAAKGNIALVPLNGTP